MKPHFLNRFEMLPHIKDGETPWRVSMGDAYLAACHGGIQWTTPQMPATRVQRGNPCYIYIYI
jgi:hypothetical protein